MSVQEILSDLNQFLSAGRVDDAMPIAFEHAGAFEDPRALLPLLDALDKQKKDQDLERLVTRLAELDLLPVERTVFLLRAKYRAGDHGGCLVAIYTILARAPNHIEALRTGGRIGNLQKDDDLALGFWERLARAAATDGEAALQSARIRARRQDHEQALEWARRAAALRPDATEALQIAVASGQALGWTETCDSLLSQLFEVDRPRAMRVTTNLVGELEAESAARVLSLLLRRFPSDKGLSGLVSQTYPEWMLAALEQELASHDFEAADYYRAASRLRPDVADPQNGLDRLSKPSLIAMREAFNARDFEAAIQHGLIATRIDPKCLEAWQTVARANFNRGEMSKALEAFRHCTVLQPRDGRTWLTQGLMLSHSGDRPGALKAFLNAKQFGPLSDSELRNEADASIAALFPQLVRDAQNAVERGELEAAWLCCESAAIVRPKDQEVERLIKRVLRDLREQIRRGWENRSPELTELCRRYLSKSPGETYVKTVLARTLMASREYGDALPIWEELSKSAPDDGHFHLQIARCCRALRIRERGVGAAQAALRIDPAVKEATDLLEQLRTLPPGPAR